MLVRTFAASLRNNGVETLKSKKYSKQNWFSNLLHSMSERLHTVCSMYPYKLDLLACTFHDSPTRTRELYREYPRLSHWNNCSAMSIDFYHKHKQMAHTQQDSDL